MADDQDLSEDYILELLKKDAEKVSTSYKRNGIYDVLPKRPTTAAPKPNTRFLRNIIRNTDNHNAALKQKELGDAGRRLRFMAQEKVEQTKHNNVIAHHEQQDHGRENGSGYTGKRKRDSGRRYRSDTQDYRRRRDQDRSSSPDRNERRPRRIEVRKYSRSRSPEERRRQHRSHRSRHASESEDCGKSGSKGKEVKHTSSLRRSKQTHERSQSKDIENYDRHSESKSSHRSQRGEKSSDTTCSLDDDRDLLRKSSGTRSRSRDRNRRHHRARNDPYGEERRSGKRRSPSANSMSDHKSHAKSSKNSDRRVERSHDVKSSKLLSRSGLADQSNEGNASTVKKGSLEDDDDPLSSFLGPEPAFEQKTPHIRGRGTTAFTSGIDERFSSTYDPTADVIPDLNTVEDEDWDQALEALRDRQRFRKAGADRLLAAGFTKEEIERMERGGERNENDVRWTKKGEAREWDRGKMADENGFISVDGDKFGRLV